jgi:UDPglucose--hexose-1-phosphate uridylyltransferase
MLRYDVTTNDWVIFAPSRTIRPDEFAVTATSETTSSSRCPFCPGHEEMTPPEIAAFREGDGWTVRVVPNKFPA